jgi:shikimate kinase/3-dehydroquinate synthase
MMAGKAFPGVVLVGFMGSGKTEVGKELARRFAVPFVDVDARIESAAGCSIRELFAREGETAFRERERAAIRELFPGKGCVIATGGGAFADAENRRLLKSCAPVVYLETSVATLLGRLEADTDRPLLGTGNRRAVVEELLARRVPGYREADFTVRTDGRTVEEVADRIARWILRREDRRVGP